MRGPNEKKHLRKWGGAISGRSSPVKTIEGVAELWTWILTREWCCCTRLTYLGGVPNAEHLLWQPEGQTKLAERFSDSPLMKGIPEKMRNLWQHLSEKCAGLVEGNPFWNWRENLGRTRSPLLGVGENGPTAEKEPLGGCCWDKERPQCLEDEGELWGWWEPWKKSLEPWQVQREEPWTGSVIPHMQTWGICLHMQTLMSLDFFGTVKKWEYTPRCL